MSFRCDICEEQQPVRTPENKVVLETRMVRHPRRDKVHRVKDAKNPKDKWKSDPGGEGTQIVREARACRKCAGLPDDDTQQDG